MIARKAIIVQLGLTILLLFLASVSAQEPKTKPGELTKAVDDLMATTSKTLDHFEEQAITYRKRALDAQREAAIQPQLIAIREQLLKQIDGQPAVQAELKAIAAMEQAYSDRKVKEAGKDPKTHAWNGKEAVPIAPTPIAEKK